MLGKLICSLAIVWGTFASSNEIYTCSIDGYMKSSSLYLYETTLENDPISGSFMLSVGDSRLRFSSLYDTAPAALFKDLEVSVSRKQPRDNHLWQGFVYESEEWWGKILVDTSVRPVALLYTSLAASQLLSISAKCS